MRRLSQIAIFGCLLLVGTKSGLADVFNITIDTSGQTGIGGIYFQFNPGVTSDPASVSISNFSIPAPGGLIAGDPNPGFDLPPGTDGDVSGSLDSPPLILRNTGGLNDYLQYLTFGSSISFQLAFNLPASFTGDPSNLGLEITDSGGLGSVFPVDSNNFNVEMTFDKTGQISISNTTSLIEVAPAVPEPGSILLLATVLALVGLLIFRKKRMHWQI